VKLSVTIPSEEANLINETERKAKLILDVFYGRGVNSSQIELAPIAEATEENTTTKWVFTLLRSGLTI
jgi:hypothetical protein